MKSAQFRTYIVLIALNLLNFTQAVEAATVTLATSPLANATASVVRPNIMYVLDNSGSMNWDYLPDYVAEGSSGTGSKICWEGIKDSNDLATCDSATTASSSIVINSAQMDGNSGGEAAVEVPLFTSDINFLYYNPATYYKVPVKADGSNYPNSVASAAYTDGFAASGSYNLATTVATTGTASIGSTAVTVASTAGLAVGMRAAGSGIASDAFIAAISGSVVTLNKKTTAALSATPLSFTSGAYPHQVFCSASTTANAAATYSAIGGSSAAVTSTGTTTNSSTSVTAVSTTGLFVGMAVTGTGISAGTKIAAIPSSTTLTLSASATASGSPTLTFTPVCVENTNTTSDSNALYPSSTFNNLTSYNGAPYYYTMSAMEYCTDSVYTDCLPAADATHTVPAPYRWCSTYDTATKTYSNCQDLRTDTYDKPDYLGGYASSTISAVQAYADLTISSYIPGKSITSLTVNGTNVIGGSTFVAGSGGLTSTNAIAVAICSAIQANTATSGYSCPSAPAANTLRIKANIPPAHASYTAPNGYAVVVGGPAVTPGTAATGTITINSTAGATVIQDITIGGVSVLTVKPKSFADGTLTNTIATTLAGLIGNGFSATAAGSVITITSDTAGVGVGSAIVVTSTATSTRPSATLSLTVAPNSSNTITVTAGDNASCSSGTISLGSASTSTSESGTSGCGFSDPKKRATNTLKTLYGSNTNTATSDWQDEFSGVGSCDTTVTYYAPAGTTYNGKNFCVSFSPSSSSSSYTTTGTSTTFSGGTDIGVQGNSTSGTMAGTLPGGPIATSPSTLLLGSGANQIDVGRVGVGKFTRVDIVPSNNSYTKASGRTDCAGATCTYAEELQNFANWFSYYRARLLLMKTTSTLAFHELDSKYRVGFEKLSNYPNNSIGLEVAQFVDSGGETANQRTNWWNDLTSTTTSGSTPLRSSLMKMGKYYGGKLTSAAAVPAAPATSAIGSIRLDNTTNDGATISSITIEGVSMLDTAPSTFTVSGCGGSCSSSERSTVAQSLLNRITSKASYATSGYTASRSGSTIFFTAVATGTAHNGDDIQVTKGGTMALAISDLAGGKEATPAIPATIIEPLQYSCQQNFTLLVTDGYWNSDGHSDLTQLDGTTEIGNQDNVNTGVTARPYYDGAQDSTTCTDSGVSSCGTLADIAMYYYKTDLRDSSLGNETSGATSLNVAVNNVFKSPTDDNQNQHMVLFTMGLGAPGTLRYRGDYATASSGDYHDISTGAANWPAPQANDPKTIDDLWHAAVNGRGKYFSARDPESVVDGLTEAFSTIQVREGAAAAAATSNLQPIAGDNFAYVASYTTNEWSGDLQARTINLVSGAVSEPLNASPNDCVSDTGCPWSAKKKLDSLDWTTRKVYMASTSGAALRAFTYANLTATEKTYFDPSAGIAAYGTGPLSQYASVFATNPTDITATKMVDFLRGDTSLEAGNTLGNPEVWRDRAHVLGDIVNTQPTFVRVPTATYQDSGYSAFVTAQADREGVVYVSANDGMLHAFASDDFEDGTVTGGSELWSFIPTEELPYLRYLADQDYVHRYFVDGQITVGDVNFGGGASDWHTILVGGLGGGGKSYYALDVTDPVNPKYLWEFTHADLGYTYGNISINKLPSGEWAVLFSSGYNNASGEGLLYAVNPETGALRTGYPISNGSGSAGSPSNLGKIAAWVDNVQANNTATEVYGGDMDGDLWRFDLTSQTTFKLAHLEDGSGNPQPITTRPEMTLNDGARIVYIGTGRYLGDLDPPDTSVQSFYAFTDTLGAPNLGGATQETWNPRTDTGEFLQRKLIALKNDGSQITREDSSGNTVEARQICTGASSEVSSTDGKCINETGGSMDWATMGGWYFDFPDSGERVNVDMNLTLGTLTIPSNVPASSACTSGGYGWVNYIDFRTGLEVDSTLIVSQKVANALIVGLNVIKIGDKLIAIVTTSDFNHDAVEPPGAPGKFKGKRDLWRELDPY